MTVRALWEAMRGAVASSGWRRLRVVPARYVAGFVVLTLVFLAGQLAVLRLPELVRAQAGGLDGLHLTFSDVRLELLPPALVFDDVTLGGPRLHNERIRADRARLSLAVWPLFTGKGGGDLELWAGKGEAHVAARHPLFGAGGATDLRVTARNYPLDTLSAVPRFDRQARASLTLQGTASLLWQADPSGALLPRSCDGDVRGEVRIATLRNDVRALLTDRFDNATLLFNGRIAGRTFTLHELRFNAAELDVRVTGKGVIDWRAPLQTELNLVADVKTTPDAITPLLLTESLRERLARGQTLAVAVQGTLFAPVLAPVQ